MNIETEEEITAEEAERRRSEEQRLNDLARTQMGETGKLYVTPDVMALDFTDRRTLRRALEAYDSWDDGDDPYGVHDFGCLYGTGPSGEMVWSCEAIDTDEEPFEGTKIFWKIDVYATDMKHGAETPWIEGESVGVLTIMTASEY